MKFRHIIPALLTLSMLTACGGRPDGISDEMYNYAESVIKTTDAYLDNQLSYEEASQKIKGLESNAEKIYNDPNYSKNDLVYLSIAPISGNMYFEHKGTSTYAELVDLRNTLAKNIGYSERD